MSKRIIAIGLGLVILVSALFFLRGYWNQRAAAMEDILTEPAARGALQAKVEADGQARANQTALLTWQTSGTVEQVLAAAGDQVVKDQELAVLANTSLPQSMILAQADLVNAQRELEQLHQSRLQQAQAQKAVEAAQQDLEDALNPDLSQAEALAAVTAAQKEVEEVQRNYDILRTPPSQSAIDQAYARTLVTEKNLNETQRNYNRIEVRYNRNPANYLPWESKNLYKRILEGLERKLLQDRLAHERAVDKYEQLLEPPDPEDVSLAEAALALSKARLAQLQRDLERIQDGPSQAEIAVLEARLADAQREWQRVKDGPGESDIAVAETKIAAAQAAIKADRISAPFSGTITEVANQPGDLVNPGDTAFRLDDVSRMLVDASVSEIDINKIKLGQTAIVTFDSAAGAEYYGQVVELPAFGSELDGVANFTVVIELDGSDWQVRPGMTATVAFVTGEAEDVLLVPNQALRFQDGTRVVYVLRDGEPEPVKVELGISSEIYSQVVESDLQVGDQILLNPPGN